MDDERVNRLANLLSSAVDAHKRGVRINDSMTFEEAKWANFGRKMHEAIKAGKPTSPKVIEASGRFSGGAE